MKKIIIALFVINVILLEFSETPIMSLLALMASFITVPLFVAKCLPIGKLIGGTKKEWE